MIAPAHWKEMPERSRSVYITSEDPPGVLTASVCLSSNQYTSAESRMPTPRYNLRTAVGLRIEGVNCTARGQLIFMYDTVGFTT